MLRFFIFIAVFVTGINILHACDVCGSGNGSFQGGILPNFFKNSFSLRMRHERLNLINIHNGYSQFQSIETRFRYRPTKKLLLQATLPYHMRETERIGGAWGYKEYFAANGIGDASIGATYVLFDNADSLLAEWKHNFQIGTLVKGPTGQWRAEEALHQLAGIMPGTGSFDVSVNSSYTLRKNEMGLILAGQYTHNGTNANSYHFGDNYSMSANLFYWFRLNDKTIFLPQVGIAYQHIDKDASKAELQSETGGNVTSLSAQLEFYYKKWGISLQGSLPIQQKFNGSAFQQQGFVAAQLTRFF